MGSSGEHMREQAPAPGVDATMFEGAGPLALERGRGRPHSCSRGGRCRVQLWSVATLKRRSMKLISNWPSPNRIANGASCTAVGPMDLR